MICLGKLVDFASKSWEQNSLESVWGFRFCEFWGKSSSNGHGSGSMISKLWILLTLIQVSSLCSMVE